MTNTFKRLITGTRALESRLTTAFEQAAQTVAGVKSAPPPLEVIDLAVDEIASHVQPAGRGRYSFPFNSVTVTFVAPTREDEARFEAICAGPPSIEDRVRRRLESAGCDNPDLDVAVVFVETLPSREVAAEWSPGLKPRPTVSEGSLTPEQPNAISQRGIRHFDIGLARVAPTARPPRAVSVRVDLEILSGTAGNGEYSFTSFPVAIGRGADVRDSRNQLLRINHVAFVEGDDDVNRTVSRRHARIELDEIAGRLRLVDDNSAQGTSVIRGSRGIAVPRGSRGLGLQTGDEIVLGQARVKVRVESAL